MECVCVGGGRGGGMMCVLVVYANSIVALA